MPRSRLASWTGLALVVLLPVLLARSLGVGRHELARLALAPEVLGRDLALSFARTTLATLGAWSAGILVGYALHASEALHRLTLPTINFVRNISPFAWLPFAVVWFGLGEGPVAFILLVALFFPAVVAAADAFAHVEPDYVDEALVLGAGRWRMLLDVKLPLALPALVSLLRILWSLGWATVVAAEMLGVDSGLGFRLLDFRYLVQYPPMLIYLVVMGLVGIGVDRLLRRLARGAARRFR